MLPVHAQFVVPRGMTAMVFVRMFRLAIALVVVGPDDCKECWQGDFALCPHSC
jgi:hypothetical protein